MHVFYIQLDPMHMCLAVHTICTCILMTSEQSVAAIYICAYMILQV